MTPTPHCDVLVVGAGPAGLAAVGVLLDQDVRRVVWVDVEFGGGRLARYESVPSNTKTSLFVHFATACDSFQRVWASHAASPASCLARLQSLPQEHGCELSHAARLVTELAHGLCEADAGRLVPIRATCGALYRAADRWRVTVGGGTWTADRVVFATGSHPKEGPVLGLHRGPAIKSIELDTALAPSLLPEHVGPEDVVAVVGSSHSAVLVLKNLCEMHPAHRPRRVVNFYRGELVFAEYLPDGRIKHDNTGLKGLAAEWARTHLAAPAGGAELVTRIRLPPGQEAATYETHLPQCTRVVHAIGYVRADLPRLLAEDGRTLEVAGYDEEGRLQDEHGSAISGLYGVGIAFPERVVDPSGDTEHAVGLWKFMRHCKRIVPAMLAAGQ